MGVVHLDLKPSNLDSIKSEHHQVRRVIIIFKHFQIKIGDFGLSRQLNEDGQVRLENACGTYGYIAPEVKKSALVDTKADIWSLGITLYMMSVAYMPHHVKGYKYGKGEIPFRP